MITFSVEDRLAEMGVALDEFGDAYEAIFNQGVASVAKAAHNEWVRLAQERCHTSREIYVNGLRAAESFKITETNGAVRADITLVGREANNFEYGMGSFDMKSVRPGWLGGGKVKHGKNGDYVVIPFRHSKSDNSRFGYTGKAKAVSGPDLKTQLRAATKRYGLDRAMTGSAGEVATRRIPNKAPVHPYLKGLQKTEYAQPSSAKKGFSRSSTLTTFRVMSENSPASSWIHPGLKAKNLLAEVEAFTDKEFDRMIDVILMGAG